ncbi:hypothetical protein HPGCJGGD_3739 [Methylobacterium haplocladii]|nr:hypothetical protein HPGCJGGD_3739 [Methylobacterium haplocladii]
MERHRAPGPVMAEDDGAGGDRSLRQEDEVAALGGREVDLLVRGQRLGVGAEADQRRAAHRADVARRHDADVGARNDRIGVRDRAGDLLEQALTDCAQKFVLRPALDAGIDAVGRRLIDEEGGRRLLLRREGARFVRGGQLVEEGVQLRILGRELGLARRLGGGEGVGDRRRAGIRRHGGRAGRGHRVGEGLTGQARRERRVVDRRIDLLIAVAPIGLVGGLLGRGQARDLRGVVDVAEVTERRVQGCVGGLQPGFDGGDPRRGIQAQGSFAQGLRRRLRLELRGQRRELGAGDRSLVAAVDRVGRGEFRQILVAETGEDRVERGVRGGWCFARNQGLAQLPVLSVLSREIRHRRAVEAAENQLQVIVVDGSRVLDLLDLGGDVGLEIGAGQPEVACLGLDRRGVEAGDLGNAQAHLARRRVEGVPVLPIGIVRRQIGLRGIGQLRAVLDVAEAVEPGPERRVGTRPLILHVRDLGGDRRHHRVAGDRRGVRRRLDPGEVLGRRLDGIGRAVRAGALLCAVGPIGRVIAGEVRVIDVAVAAVLLVQRVVLLRTARLERVDRLGDIGRDVRDALARRLVRVELGVVVALAVRRVERDRTGRVRLLLPVGPICVVVALAGGLESAERGLILEIGGRTGQGEVLPDAADELGQLAVVADHGAVDVEQISGVDLDVDVAVGGQAVEAQVARDLAHADRAAGDDVGPVAARAAAVELDRRPLGAEAAAGRQIEHATRDDAFTPDRHARR